MRACVLGACVHFGCILGEQLDGVVNVQNKGNSLRLDLRQR